MTEKNYSKIEVAREQLEEAIKLFFENRSTIAVHTLCSASFTVLKDLNKRNKSIFNIMDQRIKPEARKFFWNRHANFAKHADKDPDGILKYNDLANDLKIGICCIGYREITKETSKIIDYYSLWMFTFYTDLFIISEKRRKFIEIFREQAGMKDIKRSTQKRIGLRLINNEFNLQFKDPELEEILLKF